jgi:hypothetical protein
MSNGVPLRPQDDIELSLTRLGGDAVDASAEPFTTGIPLPKGAVTTCDEWSLCAADGCALPIQTRVLDRWSDGSLRWVLLDAQTPTGRGNAPLRLRLGGSGNTAHEAALRVDRSGDGVRITTGPHAFAVSPASSGLIQATGAKGLLRVAGDNGNWPVRWKSVTVEEAGPLRTVVRADGTADASGKPLTLRARLHFFAGIPAVRFALTVTNPSKAVHRDGFWELGDPASVLVRELSLIVEAATPSPGIQWSTAPGAWGAIARRAVAIYQDSSGGANWKSTNHVNGAGVVPLAFRGFRADVDGDTSAGERATPIVAHTAGDDFAHTTLAAAVPDFWQNFPRALSANADAITVSFWPRQSQESQELQGGEQKTHECVLLFGADPVSAQPLAWARCPLLVHPAPEWYAAAGASPYLVPAHADPHADYKALADAAIEGDDTFIAKRERADEYGWRHFGDIYGDHEAVRHAGPTPLMSHYNNQYDPIGGFARQFMRTGDPRWWTQCSELASHVIDIDIYHTNDDKSAYNNGLFWHTVHYIDAGKAAHRTYPRAKGSNGGGPASEQNYPTGLALHYFMTGSEASRETAIGLARFVISMDDGRRTVFSVLDRGRTGLASASGSVLYHGPGRGSGNSLNALVDGHRLTGEQEFLDKVEELIRRCTHPDDDVPARNLLDAERRWFYTMYLQALGKYLDHKAELGQLDAMYAYGRDALLTYARWMAANERPYLSVPEILEFPTETWPAQDIRKSEVFDYAAMHAEGAEREQFLERARFFFDYSTSALKGFKTRTLARPVVLVVVHGSLRASAEVRGVPVAPRATTDWDRRSKPVEFVPQRVRAMRRARAFTAAAAALAVAVLATVAFAFFQ